MIEKCYEIMNWIIATVLPLLIMGIFTAVFYRVFVCGKQGISPGKFCGYVILAISISSMYFILIGLLATYGAGGYAVLGSSTMWNAALVMYAVMSLIIVLEAMAAVIVEFRKS